MVTNYPEPDAGGYNAPSPRDAVIAQQVFEAPSSGADGTSHGAFDAMDDAPDWTGTLDADTPDIGIGDMA